MHEVRVRSSGPYLFGELHLETKKNLSVEKAHEISDKVEEMIRREVEKLETLLVQVEPVKKRRDPVCTSSKNQPRITIPTLNSLW
nr:cation transporter dimerization domain-containing protein [Methanobacterium formicicum]